MSSLFQKMTELDPGYVAGYIAERCTAIDGILGEGTSEVILKGLTNDADKLERLQAYTDDYLEGLKYILNP